LAAKTRGFSGADLAFVVQRATKLAIKDSIAADIAREKAREAEGEDAMVDEEEADPVPELTIKHLEEAMSEARRSVPDSEIMKYEAFNQSLKASRGAGTFSFDLDGTQAAPSNTTGGANFQDAGPDDLYE